MDEELTAALNGLQTEMTGAMTELTAEVDAINSRLAGLSVGPAVGSGANAAKAEAEFTTFLQRGLTASMESISSPDGGYTTRPELESTIRRFMENVSPMRRVCRVVSTSSADYGIVFSTGGIGSGWVQEKESRPETTSPKLAMISIPVHELYANPGITQTLLDDSSFSMQDFLQTEILLEFARKENTAFATGTGVGQPKGLLSHPTAETKDADRAFGTIEFIKSGSSGAFPATAPGDVLVDLVYRLHSGYRANAVWMMNSTVAGTVRKFKDGEGRYLWSDSLVAGQPPTLLGHPVELNEDFPDLAANSLSIAFGDFRSGCTIVDRIGVRVLRDPYTNKPYVMFYTTKRVGFHLVDSRAIKLVKFAA